MLPPLLSCLHGKTDRQSLDTVADNSSWIRNQPAKLNLPTKPDPLDSMEPLTVAPVIEIAHQTALTVDVLRPATPSTCIAKLSPSLPSPSLSECRPWLLVQ